MKIAVIGSGVSGLASAYLLAQHHEVTIFEKSDRLGGHAHTLHVSENGQDIAVDNGFMVFNPKRYPFFVRWMNELGIESVETTMSFSVNIPGSVHYEGSPRGFFADRRNAQSPRFIRFIVGIVRFRLMAKRALRRGIAPDETLAEFLRRHAVSQDVASWFLYPMLSAIWSIQDPAKAGDFPAMATFRFLDNHRLLDFRQPTWRTILHGSEQYVEAVRKSLLDHNAVIRTGAIISAVTRTDSNVTITVDGKDEIFDKVIIATHADSARALISDITPKESKALNLFSYTTNRTVLHKDTSVVPDDDRLLAAWNYVQPESGKAVFTYCMNILQHIPRKTPVFVTLNPSVPIEKELVYAEEVYEHPAYTVDSLKGKDAITELQGQRNTFFAGAHLGYGFHEDGVQSAVDVARRLGVKVSWEK